jgi:peptide/nickel transport system substrate-binding protein
VLSRRWILAFGPSDWGCQMAMRPARGLVLTAAATAATFVATIGLAESRSSASPDGTLRILSSDPIDSLDPGLASSPTSIALVYATCSPLLRFPLDRSGPVPDAAESLPTVSDGGRRYVFTVRAGMRFSDGRSLTGANYATAITRVQNAALGSPWMLLGGVARDIVAVSARGRRLAIRLERPDGSLPARLAMPWACPVPVGLPPSPLGIDKLPASGPYAVTSYVPGQRAVLDRNPYYRGKRLRRPDEIAVRIEGTQQANAAAVDDGQYDYVLYFWLFPPPPDQVLQDLASRYGVNRGRFLAAPAAGTIYLALNTERPLFHNNPRLRRAVNFALARGEIMRQGGFLRGRPTDRLLPARLSGAANEHVYPVGAPKVGAAQKLATGHLGTGTAVLYVADEPVALRRADVIQAELARIGLQVKIKSFPRPVLAAKVATRGEPFDLVLTGWLAQYTDPEDFLVRLLDGRTLRPKDNFNLSYFDVEKANRVIESAARLPAPQRYRAFAKVETSILRTYAPVAPLFTPYDYLFLSARVGCYSAKQGAALKGGFPDWGSFCLR